MPRKQTIHIAMKSQRGKIPQPYAISATDKNLRDRANSRKARTTLKDVIQSPDLGACLIHCGNIAKSANGSARAIAKPNIPIAGAKSDLPAASTKSVPMMGPVQENETITNVNAISSMLKKPPVERALLSKAVDHESGKVISKSPKKDSAKTTNNAKKKRLTIALVDSALSADAPKIIVISKPNPT